MRKNPNAEIEFARVYDGLLQSNLTTWSGYAAESQTITAWESLFGGLVAATCETFEGGLPLNDATFVNKLTSLQALLDKIDSERGLPGKPSQ
jgi:hypothetical protein